MKNYRHYLRLVILAICILASVDMPYLLAQYETEERKQEEVTAPTEDYYKPEKDSKEKPLEARNKLCPVDLTKITTGDKFTYTYKGKTYRFGSSESIEEFKKDPEKYLKEWEKKEQFYKINIIYD